MKRWITQVFILITIAVWIIYDLLVYNIYGNPSTISAVVWRYCWHIPGIPFAVGVLIGHLVYQFHEPTAFPEQITDDQKKP